MESEELKWQGLSEWRTWHERQWYVSAAAVAIAVALVLVISAGGDSGDSVDPGSDSYSPELEQLIQEDSLRRQHPITVTPPSYWENLK